MVLGDLGEILLSGFRDNDRERQRSREVDDDERRRRRRHRSHRHAPDERYSASHSHRKRRDDDSFFSDRRHGYADGRQSSRRDADYTSNRKSVVEARGGSPRKSVAARGAPTSKTEESARPRRSRVVSMRRSPSSSSATSLDDRDTPPTTPGSGPARKSTHKYPPSSSRPHAAEVHMRGIPQNSESNTEDDYSHLRPGKRQIRTGNRTEGAHGTDFLVGVPSDIGSLSSDSDSEIAAPAPLPVPMPEPPNRGMHLKIVTKPLAADKMMTGALTPGTAPHRTVGPPTSRPLVTRTNSKQDSVFGQLLRPSPHHSNLKRRSTAGGRTKKQPTATLPSPKIESPNVAKATPVASSPTIRRRATAPAVSSTPENPPEPPTEPPIEPPIEPPTELKPEPEPEPTLECLTCCDDVPKSKAAVLDCEHVMCEACLKRVFKLSTTDPAHMPPKCCTEKHIPLKFVAPLFDNKFKVLWNKKFQEYTTKDRMYCPKKGCGEWIQPRDQKLDKSVGRRCGTCPKCKTKVCNKCNSKWHGSKDCKNDEETKKLLDTAKEEGWQRCYDCKAMVQLAEGCNHMKCRCTAEFCMLCGSKWKTCDCPWFNTPPENDPMGPMGGLFFPPPAFLRPRVRRQPEFNGGAGRVFLDPGAQRGRGGFAAEMAERRAQEQADEEYARRLQMGDLEDGPNPFDHMVGRQMDMAGGAGAIDFLAQLTRMVIDGANNAAQETQRRELRLGRHTTLQAGWTRPRRRATVNERSRARAPDPPTAVEVTEWPDSDADSDDWNSDLDSIARMRRQRNRRRSPVGGPGRASAAAMAGLAREGRRGRDRVGGWLDHIAGGDVHQVEHE